MNNRMPTYKLTYFDMPARAETTRLLFHLAGQPFEDIRLTEEQWKHLKPTAPFSQLPLLEMDGITVCQSGAINNLLAKRFGFAGSTEMESVRIEMVVGCIEDIFMQVVRPIIYAPTDEAKAALSKGAQKKLDLWYDNLEALLVANNGGDGYFVGEALSLADVMFLCRAAFSHDPKLRTNWKKIPKLKALKNKLLQNPKIIEWREQHPEETVLRLTYFNTEGRAETSRMLFALADQEYEDVRLTKEEWEDMKESSPFGQLPILDVDDTTICQSHTIERYLANRFELAGKTSMEKAQTDMVVDCLEDFTKVILEIFYEQDAAKQAELRKKVSTENTPAFLANMEKMFITNGGKEFFVGSEIGLADVAFCNVSSGIEKLGISVDWTSYPNLKSMIGRVLSNPRISQWITKRPTY